MKLPAAFEFEAMNRADVMRDLLKDGDPDAKVLSAVLRCLSCVETLPPQSIRFLLGDKREIVRAFAEVDTSTSEMSYLTAQLSRITELPTIIVLRERGFGLVMPNGETARSAAAEIPLRQDGEVRHNVLFDLIRRSPKVMRLMTPPK